MIDWMYDGIWRDGFEGNNLLIILSKFPLEWTEYIGVVA